jgi:hypothetical protein
MEFRSVAFPALATGVARLSPERSAVAMLIEAASHLASKTSLTTVVLALYPRPGLPRDVLPRFYSQVQELIERTQQIRHVTDSLQKLEHVYREFKSPGAARQVVQARDNLLRHRDTWEREMLDREPGDSRRERSWREYRDDMEPELERISALRKGEPELGRFGSEEIKPMDVAKLESEYTEYRSAAVREMIIIRKRNITDIEKEQTIRGFSTELNRSLEAEREHLQRLELELRELQT